MHTEEQEVEVSRRMKTADRYRVRDRAATALRREIISWVSELKYYGEHFSESETAKFAELLKLSRALHRALSK
jgi:hypothetical protein